MGKLDKFKKAPGYIGALLAGAIAAEGPAPAQEAVTHNPDAGYSDTYNGGDYDAGYSDTYDTSSYELHSSEVALRAIKGLDALMNGANLQVTTEQVKQISEFVDKFIQDNPEVKGVVEETKDDQGVVTEHSESASYDPLFDLWQTASKNPPQSPVVAAVLLKELDTRMQANSNEAAQ